jgi:hypothetical protein
LPALAKEQIAEINRELVARGVDVFEVTAVKNDLERIFIEMVSD